MTEGGAGHDSLYPYRVEPDEESGYVIVYPDLPGCMTQVEDAAEIGPMAEEIKALWLETARAHGMNIPPASPTPSYSGKLEVRVPRTLHRDLAESAAREKIGLDEYVTMLLARRDSMARIEQRLGELLQGNASPGPTSNVVTKPLPDRRRSA